MWEAIKKSMGTFDWLIFIAAFYMFSHFDYSNLDMVEIVYIVTFVLWFVMLGARIFITYRGKGEKK